MFGGRGFDRDQEREGSRELVREPVRDALWEPQREPVPEPAVGRQPFEARDRRNDIPQQDSPTRSALANLVAFDGVRVVQLGAYPLTTNGAQIRKLVSEKVQIPFAEVKISFLGSPVEEHETLQDMGYDSSAGDRINFHQERVGGQKYP